MWIVKLGGSLLSADTLQPWLEVLAQLGGGRTVIVPGGGLSAELVRSQQQHWQLDDLTAHNMALLAMAQTGLLMQGLHPQLIACRHPAEIFTVLHSGRTAIWLPLDALQATSGPDTGWHVTSDSLALDLSTLLHAEGTIVVKSCAIDPLLDAGELADAGIVDAAFAERVAVACQPVALLSADEPGRLADALLANRFPDPLRAVAARHAGQAANQQRTDPALMPDFRHAENVTPLRPAPSRRRATGTGTPRVG